MSATVITRPAPAVGAPMPQPADEGIVDPYATWQREAVMIGVPAALPRPSAAPAEFDRVDELPVRAWMEGPVAQFTYPRLTGNTPYVGDYNHSVIWASPMDLGRGDEGQPNYDKYLAAGTDFDRAVALANKLASPRPDDDILPGAMGIMQAVDGVYYLAEMRGWGDNIPYEPGDTGNPELEYQLEDVQASGGVVRRGFEALKAVVGATTWVDFREHDEPLPKQAQRADAPDHTSPEEQSP